MQISGTPTFIIGTLDDRGNLMSVKKTVVGAYPFGTFKSGHRPPAGGEIATGRGKTIAACDKPQRR